MHYIPDLKNMNRSERFAWGIANPELAEYSYYRHEILSHYAFKGYFVNEEANRDILFGIWIGGDFAFNRFVDYLENAHPVETDEERSTILSNFAYPKDLAIEAFQNICDTYWTRQGIPELSDNRLEFTYASIDEPYDPLWWVFRFADMYLESAVSCNRTPFEE